MQSFDMQVYQLTYQIPPGKVTTYGAIAKALRMPNHSRQVGATLAKNPYAPTVPCHRVVYSDGKVGAYFSETNSEKKAKMLMDEGIIIVNDKVCNFKEKFWTDFFT